MKTRLVILALLFIAFFLTLSCISQVAPKEDKVQNIQESLQGEKLLTSGQIEMLSGVTTIVLADYDENQKPQKKRELTQTEVESLVKELTNAVKDTTTQIDNSRPYSLKMVLKGPNYFLTLLMYKDSEQLKVGDIQHGVVITGVNQGFLNAIKKIVERE